MKIVEHKNIPTVHEKKHTKRTLDSIWIKEQIVNLDIVDYKMFGKEVYEYLRLVKPWHKNSFLLSLMNLLVLFLAFL